MNLTKSVQTEWADRSMELLLHSNYCGSDSNMISRDDESMGLQASEWESHIKLFWVHLNRDESMESSESFYNNSGMRGVHETRMIQEIQDRPLVLETDGGEKNSQNGVKFVTTYMCWMMIFFSAFWWFRIDETRMIQEIQDRPLVFRNWWGGTKTDKMVWNLLLHICVGWWYFSRPFFDSESMKLAWFRKFKKDH